MGYKKEFSPPLWWMNECLNIKEELILIAQNWTEIKIKNSYKLYKENQIMVDKFEDKCNLFIAIIKDTIISGGIKLKKWVTEEKFPLEILIKLQWS